MIIVELAGGLGNQMQQYAIYHHFKTLGREARLDKAWFRAENQADMRMPRQLELEYFEGLPMEFCTEVERDRLRGREDAASKLLRKLHLGGGKRFAESEMYHPELFDLEDAYVQGYFACQAYHQSVQEDLRRLFVFPEARDPKARDKNAKTRAEMAEAERSGEVTVSLHLRRGDYLEAGNAELYGGICTPAYYEGAVKAVRRLYPGRPLRIYLFSDDPGYAATLAFAEAGEVQQVPDWNKGRDALLDMELMGHCMAQICANSTYSFWGARLCGREDAVRIRPLTHRNNQTVDPQVMRGLWKDWVLVDARGGVYPGLEFARAADLPAAGESC